MTRKSRCLLVLVCIVLVGILSGCSNKSSGSSGEEVTVTYWLPAAEDDKYYSDYNENPIAKYIEENYTFGGKKVHIDYYVAPTGGEVDNFNNLLATGEYTGIIDMSMSSMSVTEMYADDMIKDLTDLAEEYMPNYMALAQSDPEYLENVYSIVDGEKKILSLTAFADAVQPNYQGFCYRRDWVAKYGTHPETGQSFEYGFSNPDDPESWEDNIVFPNGTDEPIYLSDWEWMFEIFNVAMADLGITDGYGYAPYYQGYMQPGDFACAFGGEAVAYWYRNADNECVFGPQTEAFRVYLQCLNTWYNNGWIDAAFAEHNTDMFFAVDTAKVYSGKVGLWQGRQSTLGTQLDGGDNVLTEGIVVYGCRQPINDIYGDESVQNKIPRTFMQQSKLGQGIVITDKVADEDLPVLLEYIDFFFSEEGAELALGFTKERYEETNDSFYTEWELTDGLYTVTEDDGVKHYSYNIPSSDPLVQAASLARIIRLNKVENVDYGFDRYVTQATEAWDYYEAEGSLFAASVANATPAEDNEVISKVRVNVDQFMIRVVSSMIKGDAYDVWNDADWQQFCTDIGKYEPEKATERYQAALDLVTQ